MTSIQNLRYAFRTLRKTPGFTFATIVIIGFGIGANTAIFSLVENVLARELPYHDPDRLVWTWSVRADSRQTPFNLPDFLDYSVRNRTLEWMSAVTDFGANLTGSGDPVRLQGVRVSATVFRLLGVSAALGRALEPEDDAPGALPVVVVSHALWMGRWGGDPGVIGCKVSLNGAPYTLVGVMPRDFLFPRLAAEFAVPLAPDNDPSRKVRNSTNFLRVIGQLKPGFTLHQAQEDLSDIAQQLRREYPRANASKLAVRVIPFENEILGSARDSLAIVLAAVSLVLILVTVNVANSMLARSTQRRAEITLRAALGASRMDLAKHSILENLIIACLGGLLGVVVATVAVQALVRFSPIMLPRLERTAVDGGAVVFAAALSLLLGVVIGALPMWQISRDLVEDLKSATRGASRGQHTSASRTVLVVVEVGVSFALLVGAGLLSRTLVQMQKTEPGFESRPVLATRLSLPPARYRDALSIQTFVDRVGQGLESERRVVSFGIVSVLPLSGGAARVPFAVKDRPPPSEGLQPATNYRIVTPSYFRTMGIPIVAGAEFSDTNEAAGQPVVIINQQFARRYFEDRPAVGAQLLINDNDVGPREVEIVGVVGNVKQASIDEEPGLDLYIPLRQMPTENARLLTNNMTAVLRCTGDPHRLIGKAKGIILAADPEVALTARTMDDMLAASLATRRFQTFLMNLFAGFAALLVGFGLYGVMSYVTTQRSHEMGVRLALGAAPAEIAGLVMWQGTKLAGLGIGVGAALVLGAHQLMSPLLYMTDVFDPVAFGASSLFVVGITAMATGLPALQAARTDPVAVLRRE